MDAIEAECIANRSLFRTLKLTENVFQFLQVIKKDWIDPTNGAKLKEKDIIRLQRGGTGFSSTNEKLTAAVQRPVMQS